MPRKPKPHIELYTPEERTPVNGVNHPVGANERPLDEPRSVKKRRLAAALAMLVRFKGMSHQKAWLTLHPEDAHLAYHTLAQRTRKVLKWADENHPADFSQLLDQHHLGLGRVLQEVQSLLTATKFDHVQKKWVPDHRIRNEGVKHLVLINGITPRTIEMVQERRMEALAPRPTIGVGPQLTKEEWDERWKKADDQSRERFKQIAAQLSEQTSQAPAGENVIVVGGQNG